MIQWSVESEFEVQLTKRDVEILRFINEVGFCIMPQLRRRFYLSERRSYQVVKRLMRVGYIVHKRVFHGQHGVFYMGAQGSQFSDLPLLSRIPIVTYEHTLRLTDVYLKLREKYPEAEWISERRLIQSRYFDGVGKRGHVSDGLLIMPDGKHIAIEVELNLKGKNRVEKILRAYSTQLSINEVWYFCPKRILNAQAALVAKRDYVKIFNIDEFLL